MHVLMINNQVQVDANSVDYSDVNFFQAVSETWLIDKLLHWIQIESESLVLCCDGTPQI